MEKPRHLRRFKKVVKREKQGVKRFLNGVKYQEKLQPKIRSASNHTRGRRALKKRHGSQQIKN
jgi:hypothetical protein